MGRGIGGSSPKSFLTGRCFDLPTFPLVPFNYYTKLCHKEKNQEKQGSLKVKIHEVTRSHLLSLDIQHDFGNKHPGLLCQEPEVAYKDLDFRQNPDGWVEFWAKHQCLPLHSDHAVISPNSVKKICFFLSTQTANGFLLKACRKPRLLTCRSITNFLSGKPW